MSTSHIYLCAIPPNIWECSASLHGKAPDIARFVTDALGCERRIAKGVNLDNEYERYTLCCQRIEQEIGSSYLFTPLQSMEDFSEVLQTGRFPVILIGIDYLNVLDRMSDKQDSKRIGASFFPPDTISSHHAAFTHWSEDLSISDVESIHRRIDFFSLAKNSGCGVVELQSAYHMNDVLVETIDVRIQPIHKKHEEQYITIPDFSHDFTNEAISSFKNKKLADNLRQHIGSALKIGEPVVFGNEARHDEITEVLHGFVFVPTTSPIQSLPLRVVYVDGSEARPFPLFCLSSADRHTLQLETAPLRVALMSMRHLELDPEIDFCWFRNRDVSRTRTLAETDQFCYESTLTQLRDSLALGDLVIHLYHTGLEPAVLGFYRGVIEVLCQLHAQKSERRLAVVPFYYRGGKNYRAGTIWQ
jgi:hypothetical protein